MADKSSDMVNKHVNQLPAMMMALMELFIVDKDYNSRAKLRLRMKSLLDFAAADTVYPTKALERPGGRMQDGYAMENGIRPDMGCVVPGANPARENEVVLGQGGQP